MDCAGGIATRAIIKEPYFSVRRNTERENQGLFLFISSEQICVQNSSSETLKICLARKLLLNAKNKTK